MRSLYPILLLLLLSSCGRLKKTTASDETLLKAEKEGTFSTESVTEERIDTLITIAPDTSTWEIPAFMFTDSSVLVIETPRQRIEFEYQPETKSVKVRAAVKEMIMPVKIERKVIHRADSSYKDRVKVKEKSYRQDVKKTAPLIPWWLWLIPILIGGGWILNRLTRSFPGRF